MGDMHPLVNHQHVVQYQQSYDRSYPDLISMKGCMMPQLTVTSDQIVDLVNQLPPHQKQAVLLALAHTARTHQTERLTYAENQLRQRAAERGLDWDRLSEDAREAFVDDLLHER